MKTIVKILLICIVFFLSVESISNGCVYTSAYTRFQLQKEIFYLQIKNKPFSEELLKKVIWYERIQYPKVVLLQAQLETGFYTSDVFLNGHNCFGMKHPKCRQTIATGTYQGHSQYNDWIDSVIDYKIWQTWFLSLGYRINAKEDDAFYLMFLHYVKYAEDPNYISKLIKLSTYKYVT